MDTDNTKYWPTNYRPDSQLVKCTHKVAGYAEWEGPCPYCEIDDLRRQLAMSSTFHDIAVKERNAERNVVDQLHAMNDRLREEIECLRDEKNEMMERLCAHRARETELMEQVDKHRTDYWGGPTNAARGE